MQIEVAGDLIEVPDGLSEEQLDNIAASHVRQKGQAQSRASTASTYSELPPQAKLATGIGAAAAEPVLGLAQLFTRAGESVGFPGAQRATQSLNERVNTIRGAREGAGGWGTAGELGAFAASGAASLPRAAARYLPQGANLLERGARAGGLGAVEQGAYEGSRATIEGDPSRVERTTAGATGGAAGGAVGGALPNALARVFEPIKTSAPARALVNWARQQGHDLTLTAGQAAGRGSPLGVVEEALAAVPVAGRAITRTQEGATETWNEGVLSEIVSLARGRKSPVSRAGPAGIREAQQAVSDAYDEAISRGTLQLNPTSFDDSLNAMVRLVPDDSIRAEKMLENINADIASGRVTGETITRLRSEINKAASSAYQQGNYALGDVMRQIDDDYQKMMIDAIGPQGAEAMKRANAAYSKMADVNIAGAMQGAVMAEGMFTPSQLLHGQRRGEPSSMLASGRTPGLLQTVQANEVLGNALPSVGPGTAEKLATMTMLAGTGTLGAQFLADDEEGMTSTIAKGITPALAYGALGTRTGARLLTPGAGSGALSRGRSWIAEALRNMDPARRSIMERALAREGALETDTEDYNNAP